jgi:hypothetical protein
LQAMFPDGVRKPVCTIGVGTDAAAAPVATSATTISTKEFFTGETLNAP